MFHSLVVTAALGLLPGAADGLTLTDVHTTHGILGPARAGTKFLPGDELYVTFTIDGISAGGDGKVQYSIGSEVTDAAGKNVFRQPAQDFEVINALGGNSLPAYARVAVGQQQPAGEYTLKVTVTDRATSKSQSLTQKFEVLPADFGVVRLTTTADPDGQVPSGVLGVGRSLWLNGAVVGFQRDAGSKQPKVALELAVLDEGGKPTLAKPFGGTIDKDVPAKDTSLPIQFHLALNRPGKFTVQVKATDQVSGKTFTSSFPITVLATK
jgi:hypothetical protein